MFQFKITLLEVWPAIWRRIQIPDCNLADLHRYIQAAFGWCDNHLHQFDIDGECYSQSAQNDDDFDMDCNDEADVLLSNLVPKSGRPSRWIYEYDFGDGWRHEVLFEGFPPADPTEKYPLCVEGERACPPEDCGGPYHYGDLVAIIRDTKREDYEELLEDMVEEWGPLDPEAFDAKKATKEMRKIK
ncbi:MAG: plasmid pRiA4b ORF-3 family protein [Planctomycetota bacterium]